MLRGEGSEFCEYGLVNVDWQEAFLSFQSAPALGRIGSLLAGYATHGMSAAR